MTLSLQNTLPSHYDCVQKSATPASENVPVRSIVAEFNLNVFLSFSAMAHIYMSRWGGVQH